MGEDRGHVSRLESENDTPRHRIICNLKIVYFCPHISAGVGGSVRQ